jgi:hypothetical protein
MKNKPEITVLACLLVCMAFFAFIPHPQASVPNPAIKLQERTGSNNRDTLDKNIKAITDSLAKMNQQLPIEKVYLHIDKPYYTIGDTLWFKSYLVNGANLTASKMSGLLYVELYNDTSTMVRRISIPIKDGFGWGQIPLPGKIFREGGYTIRAYTNWMQNFEAAYFFTQRLYIGTATASNWLVNANATVGHITDKDELIVNIKLNRVDKSFSPVALRRVGVKLYDDWRYIYSQEMQTGIDGSLKLSSTIKDKADISKMRVQITTREKDDGNRIIQVPLDVTRKIDLQFLPEGGNLVAGLKSVIGFKAITENGKGVYVSGGIFDSNGIKIVNFASLHNGMGTFELKPKKGEKYIAKLDNPNIQGFELPLINDIGTVMHISNPERDQSIGIVIYGTGNSLSNDSAYYLIGTSTGVMYYSQKVEINQPEIKVAKKIFPSGIVRFTLFKGKIPLNERAVYVDNRDQLSIHITPHKAVYSKRDSVALTIEVKDKYGSPIQGGFSLAVTDNSQVRPDTLNNNGIAVSLLLNSELKGYVESPGYYFNREDKQAWLAMDNLLLTQGWRGYTWKDVFATSKTPLFEMEKQFKITGKVTSLTKKPVANAQVIISSQKPSFIATVNTDADGKYVFKNLPQIDSGSFFIQANNSNGKKISFGNISVNNFIPAAPPITMGPIMPWYINTDSTMINRIRRKKDKENEANLELTGLVLKEVKINDRKIVKDAFGSYDSDNSDLAFDEKDIKESAVINLYDLLKQKLPGFEVVKDWKWAGGRARIKLDKFMISTTNISIDRGSLPLFIDDPYSAEELIAELKEIKIATLKSFVAVWSPRFTQNGRFPPSIMLTTINGNGWYKYPKTGTTTYRPLPITYPQQFYSPKYSVKSVNTEADYRSTIYWEPNILTDQHGRARVSFFAADLPTNYTINIQGQSEFGFIGSLIFKLHIDDKSRTIIK